MTSEVVLMNRSAVALAADSAATSRYWNGKEYETRYFKGANKIFHLSNVNPIGLMIYGTASMQSVPWEVIAKSFRDDLGGKSYDTVKEYAASLFNFIENSPLIFPADNQKNWLIARAVRAALVFVLVVVDSEKFKKARKIVTKRNAASEVLQSHKNRIQKGPFVPGADKSMIETTISEHAKEIAEKLKEESLFSEHERFFDPEEAAVAGVWGVYHQLVPGLDHTGLVFAGFGSNEFFPSAIVFDCYGLLLGKFMQAQKEDGEYQIDHNTGSFVQPMAKSDMIQTFIDGIGLDTVDEIDIQMTRTIDYFADEMMKDQEISKWDKLDEIKEKARIKFKQEIFSYMYLHHNVPMRRVVAMLPLDELADLAETLIYMESLKERVTLPEESVSGPIDVAVISKNDGFIWIKRKHYFDPKLNPRYFSSHHVNER